jgi:hypothetical protein
MTITGKLEKLQVTGMAILVVCALLALLAAVGASAALAGPRWKVEFSAAPNNLPPGGEGEISLLATNLGNAPVTVLPPGTPVTIDIHLPPGLTASEVGHEEVGNLEYVGPENGELRFNNMSCSIESASLLACTWAGERYLPEYQTLELRLVVKVAADAKTGEEDEVSITGGEAPPVSVRDRLTVSSEPTPFAVENYEMTPENEDGSLDAQAGSHPFQLTTTFALNSVMEPLNTLVGVGVFTPALPKDLRFNLPPGLVGDPTPFPQCTDEQFGTLGFAKSNLCPPDTAVGIASVTVQEPTNKDEFTIPVPLFNVTPRAGEPVRFGFQVLGVPVFLNGSIRTGGDYGVTFDVHNINEASDYISSRVTFWGVPGDPRHDPYRGWYCLDFDHELGLSCAAADEQNPPPLVTLPTSCTGPLETSVEGDSWPTSSDPDSITFPAAKPAFMEALDGCNRLGFEPQIKVAPDTEAGSSPSGLTVHVHVPQAESLVATGLSEANVKDTTTVLPEGVALNPAAADGLGSCSEGEIALDQDVGASCPDASKIGTVSIKTPVLPEELSGSVYLASQDANPFGSLVAMYIVAEDVKAGLLIKLAGEVQPNPVTGQLAATFDNTPQLPFEDLELHFFGGDRAPLSTPALCGAYTTQASIAPWSGNPAVGSSSTFDVSSGPSGSPCADPLPFNPSLTAGSTNIQAGAFSPFTMTMSREDGQQNLKAVELHMPPGLLGTLATVKLCGEAQANAGTCGQESLIGETVVSVGLGGDPYSVTGGKVYITEGYEGAPYGLSIVNPAKAGPYDLGTVVVRAKIEVDPITAALTITTDTSGPHAIPQILDGIPLQIKHVNVTINRPGFTFNPTNCSPMAITGGLTSSLNTVRSVSVPFQITNCAVLAFKPKLAASTSGKTSRANGASLKVKLTYPAGPYDANVAKVKVDLPKQLPSRLTTLQKACPAQTFDANPAACPSASIVGHATATTPVIPVPLSGPAYFVSHGGEAFPDLIIVLQGYGATVHLVGTTFISKAGVTSSTFKQVPDVPVGTFELTLPQGKYSALAANGNLCTTKLAMPTLFVGQNGSEIHTSTPISPTGCVKHVRHERKKPRHKRKK